MTPYNNTAVINSTLSAMIGAGLQQALSSHSNCYSGGSAGNASTGQPQNSQQMLIQLIMPLLSQLLNTMRQQGTCGNGPNQNSSGRNTNGHGRTECGFTTGNSAGYTHGAGSGYSGNTNSHFNFDFSFNNNYHNNFHFSAGYSANSATDCYCESDPIAVDKGRVWGDPHFVGADGGKYDVQGEAGTTYNILSDRGIQFNALFDTWGSKQGATIVSDAGITVNGHQIQFAKCGTLTVNGKVVGDGTHLDGMLIKDGNTLKVSTDEYQIDLEAVDSKYLNFDFKSDNIIADGMMPHGLWGQSADGDGKARNGDTGAGAQGGGAIEGLTGMTDKGDKSAVSLYETSGLWDTGFANFNRYC